MSTKNKGLFTLDDGRNVVVTFVLVSSLFLLWGFCNGMIDVMDKHFQEELKLSLSQSAWVQFAHWMGYFLMSLPAGYLATRLGYRGGIIAGLLMVAVGGFWFVPATGIAQFWAFLLGVCVVASGLTFLETVANPYTTVLGEQRYAATRINLAQSCNGVGWILGPIAGSMFFYAKDASGRSTGAETLWIPYAGVAVVVLILAVVFFFAPVPDVKSLDMDASQQDSSSGQAPATRKVNRGLSYALLLGNATVLIGVFGMILWLILDSIGVSPRVVVLGAGGLLFIAAAVALAPAVKRLSSHSIWAHEHFSGATLAQFFYVAAQSGIFSFLINYMTSEPPSLPSAWLNSPSSKWVEVRTAFAGSDFKDVTALVNKLNAKTDPLTAYLATNLSSSTHQTLARYSEGAVGVTPVRVALMQDLNSLVLKESIYSPERFSGVTLGEPAKRMLSEDPKARNEARLNRLLLADAYPKELGYRDGVLGITNALAAILASVGFGCFLLGRVTGAFALTRVSAHNMLGLYGVVNAILCLLVFFKLGWFSVVCVFLSYFFMSIMFPTIFALGIFGLGARAKKAAAYIVMGIVGGALLPKVMGAVADHYDMSRGFIVPLFCFAFVAFYGFAWPKLSRAEGLASQPNAQGGAGASHGH